MHILLSEEQVMGHLQSNRVSATSDDEVNDGNNMPIGERGQDD